SGLIDLRITRQGMSEQRWFKMSAGGQGLAAGAMSADQLSSLMKFAPANAQLVQVHATAATDGLSSAIEQSLFGKLPDESWSPPSFCELVRSKTETGKPFVRFERAIVAQLKPEAAVNREMLERAIVDELRARFVVAGTEPRLEWQDEGAVRFVAQALLEQGAA